MAGREREGEDQETDERFPSGPWSGFFLQDGTRVRQRMGLWFASGRLTGEGRDVVGGFVISGAYSVESGTVRFLKQYETHSVEYTGWAEGGVEDGIWGTWLIQNAWFSGRGGFHIWPEGHEAGSSESVEAELGQPSGVQR